MKRKKEMHIALLLGALALLSVALASAANGNSSDQAVSMVNSVSAMNASPNLAGVNLSLSGIVFNDLNGDSFRTQDEPGLPGWAIILEHDGKKVRTITNDSGQYIFNNLEAGEYTVTENMVPGWNQTCPGAGNYTINLVDKDAFNYDFGNIWIAGSVTHASKKHPIMSKSAWDQRTQAVKNLPKAGINPEGRAVVSYPAYFSLLSDVPYIASERDQGSCGDCWVWGCTAPIEVANDIQNGVSNRLSIQYLNSNYNGGSGSSWACCGGNELGFQRFYSSKGIFIPWSNSNANFRDGVKGCPGSTSVAASSISPSPNYPITSIQWNEIQTTGVSTTQAISNIKSYLYANKAVTLAFFLPDFTPFYSFWSNNSGNWNPDSYCGLSNGTYPGGHEVTVVGWNDTSDSWIVLNSWGIDSAHPDGTYKLKMDMNYNCAYKGSQAYSFGYFDVVFALPNTPSLPLGPASGKPGTSYSYSTSATDPNGYQVKYTFDWGDGTTTVTSFVNSGTLASASHTWSKAGTYLVKAMATDSKGATTGWSSPLSVAINTLPNTPSQPTGTASGTPGTSYSYSTSATDPDGDQVQYTFNWGDGTNSSTSLVNSGIKASVSHTWSTASTYLVKAMATDSKGAISGWSSPLSVTINTLPNTPSQPKGNASGKPGTSYSYSSSATDPDGDQVQYTFNWGDGTTTVTGLFNSGTCAGASHQWSKAGTYQVKAMATDSRGATSGWSSSLAVIMNTPPNTPSVTSGPVSGLVGSSYSYSTSATDPDGDQVQYTFNWGDGTNSSTSLVNSGTKASVSHTWSKGGMFPVKAMATDIKGATSGWSSPLSVTINTPPNMPAQPTGNASGKPGTSYSYSTSATDPDGDQVQYTFNWGDGTTTVTGLANSGICAGASHQWSKAGTYQVKAIATDSRGATSGWSSSLSVTLYNLPNTPAVPSGSASGYAWVAYSYSTSATDLDGNQVKYTFDWRDGTNSSTSLVNSGTKASASHTWSTASTYLVKAMATDSKGAISGWSSPLAVAIAANSPPNTPSQPSGPVSGKLGTSYSYSTSATDPDGDQMNYTFDWGDGTTTATGLNSGICAGASHQWSKAGTYQVKAMATDSRGASSELSNCSPLSVTISSISEPVLDNASSGGNLEPGNNVSVTNNQPMDKPVPTLDNTSMPSAEMPCGSCNMGNTAPALDDTSSSGNLGPGNNVSVTNNQPMDKHGPALDNASSGGNLEPGNNISVTNNQPMDKHGPALDNTSSSGNLGPGNNVSVTNNQPMDKPAPTLDNASSGDNLGSGNNVSVTNNQRSSALATKTGSTSSDKVSRIDPSPGFEPYLVSHKSLRPARLPNPPNKPNRGAGYKS